MNYFESIKESSHLFSVIVSQILKHSYRCYDEKSHLSLEFSFLNKNKEVLFENSQVQMVNCFFDKLISQFNYENKNVNPLILFDYSTFKNSKKTFEILVNYLKSGYSRNLVFFEKTKSNLLNSSNINVRNLNGSNHRRNRIILDKILINLHMIAENSCQNDNTFFDYLQERLDSLFELFEYKRNLMNRRLKSSNQWKRITSEFFEYKDANWINDSLKSISFFGFNKAVKTHCGIEIDRIDKSESFAYEILDFMSSIIKERNQQEDETYILTQPHNDGYLHDVYHNNQPKLGYESKRYSVGMIREDSNLSFERKIDLYKKFEKYLTGGSVFTLGMNEISLEEEFNSLIKSGLNAFQLKV